MNDEIKPCPFCGYPPNHGPWQAGIDRGWPDSYAVECSSALDDCRMNPSITDFDKESVLTAWNTRAPPVVTDEMIKRAAVAISGAPFPSKRSMDKARLVLAALDSGA